MSRSSAGMCTWEDVNVEVSNPAVIMKSGVVMDGITTRSKLDITIGIESGNKCEDYASSAQPNPRVILSTHMDQSSLCGGSKHSNIYGL